MKIYLILLLLFAFAPLHTQTLEDEEARFFAQTLYDRDVLTEEGLAQLNLEIRNQQLGARSNLLTGQPALTLPPAQLSSIIGFLSHVYREEYNFRTMKVEVGELAHSMFAPLPPQTLSLEQENALLAMARKKYGNHEGPKIESALGQDVFADDILPEYFMIFARPSPKTNMLVEERETPDYASLVSPSRSVLGNGVIEVIDLLEEMGISQPEDRPQDDIDIIETQFLAAYQVLHSLGEAVADREMAPARKTENTAFIAQCTAFGLLNQATTEKLLLNEKALEAASKFPFFNAFIRSKVEFELGFRPTYMTGTKDFMTGLRKVDPLFKDATLSYSFTDNPNPTSRSKVGGKDVTLTLEIDGTTQTISYRTNRPYEGYTEPFLHPNNRFLSLFNNHLKKIDHPKIIFCINEPVRKGEEKDHGRYLLLLLTDEEARALIRWSTTDRIFGPAEYLRPISGY